ncbi:MAG: DNA alkylation repair protein [Saprospiraceae bacterium]|nr:DNA alkylation repair protein [Saprospiraceae bacterium]
MNLPVPLQYYQTVCNTFRAKGNPDYAQQQIRYMRHQFEFFGLPMPQWMPLTRELHAAHGIPENDDLKALVRLCFEDDHRELHYFALETVQKTLKNQPADFIDFLEELICTRSWWDSVDWIAKLVGIHFKKHPTLIHPVTERWMDSGNMWLQRVSLIFQLSYREKTDTDLLFSNIRRLAGSQEFFIQKGAGWALRQYAKTNPDAVQEFVGSTKLAPLTRREALKNMPK